MHLAQIDPFMAVAVAVAAALIIPIVLLGK